MEKLSKDELRLLVTIGFAACAKGKVAQSRWLFQNLLIAYPDTAAVKVGLAFSHIVVDDFAQGESLLQEVIADSDESQDALALLAFSKALQKKSDEVKEIIEQIKETNKTAYSLAQESLRLLDL